MTEFLYMKDSYLKEFEATVTEVRNGAVILDRTAFFPAGGGVPCDTGWLTKNGTRFDVTEVAKRDDQIIHTVQNSDIKPGDTVSGNINWERRYVLMRNHTAAHLLASIFYNELNVLITGNQLDVDQSRMDFSMENFDRSLIEKVFQKANEEIHKNHVVKSYFMKREDALKIPGIIKLAAAGPQGNDLTHFPNTPELRIVEIEGIDIQLDGGCHVNSLKEIGKIEFMKAENKGKNNRRIYYTIG